MIPNRLHLSVDSAYGDRYPSGSTEVEIRAVKDSAEQAGGREIFALSLWRRLSVSVST